MTDEQASEPLLRWAEERQTQALAEELEADLRAIRELEDDLGEKICGESSLAELL